MLTLSLPINVAKTNSFYLMGGGGAYQFHHIGALSSLAESFPGIAGTSKSETKWGMTAGAGLEFHILGATSLFVQSAFTNASATGRNLSWIPLLAGLTLR
jgi:opacity protein-like surface antigen